LIDPTTQPAPAPAVKGRWGKAASEPLEAEVPGATFKDLIIDVSELASVRRAAERAAELGPINVLVNNASVMATPYTRPGDGFELQLATGPHYRRLSPSRLPPVLPARFGPIDSVESSRHARPDQDRT